MYVLPREYTPKSVFLKIDSVTSEHNNEVLARLDFIGPSVTKYYYKIDSGHFVKYAIPAGSTEIQLILYARCASSAQDTEQVFSGIQLSFAPDDSSFALEDTFIGREYNDVYAGEVKQTAETITDLCVKPCLVYSIMTDSHEDPRSSDSVAIVNNTLRNIQRVNDLAFADGAVHLGDILVANQSALYDTWAKVNEHLDDFVGRFRKVNRECFIVAGNHDGLESNTYNEFHTYGSLQKFNESYVVREGIAPWYYKDYPKTKTRVVFLAQPCRDADPDFNQSIYQIYKNQMAWLADTALDLEDGWNVLLFCHIMPYSGTWDNASLAVFEGLTNAFCNHTIYSDAGWGISVDFSSLTSSKILAMISGHAHADAVIKDNSTFSGYALEYPIIIIASSNRLIGGNSNPGYTNPTRNADSVTEDLWDTLVYRPDLGKIYLVRFGAGNDREIDV